MGTAYQEQAKVFKALCDPKRLQIPKTGDSSVLGLWGFSLCISLAGCLALTTWQIRRWREEEALQIIEK